jgi:hypothetical protein
MLHLKEDGAQFTQDNCLPATGGPDLPGKLVLAAAVLHNLFTKYLNGQIPPLTFGFSCVR